jgi:hypothetical protein
MVNLVSSLRMVGGYRIWQTRCNQTTMAFVEPRFLGNQTPGTLLHKCCGVGIVCNQTSCTTWIRGCISSDSVRGAIFHKCEQTLLATNQALVLLLHHSPSSIINSMPHSSYHRTIPLPSPSPGHPNGVLHRIASS